MAAQLQGFLSKLEKRLEEKNKLTELLGIAEEKTGVKKLYLASGGLVFLALWLVIGYGAELLCNGIGFVYPAYASIKAIESKPTNDDTKWLMYWVVFALFSCLEFFSDIFLNWFPLYWLLKCIFLVWCFAPIPANGTNLIYSRIVRPLFLKHQGKVDNLVGNFKEAASNAADIAQDVLKKD